MSDALPYTRGTRIPRLLGDWNSLNNYFDMYTHLTPSRKYAVLASPVSMGLEII